MRDMIAYMNACKAAKAASGGAKQDWSTRQAPDSELDPIELTELKTDAACSNMLLQVELMQQRLFAQFGIITETETEIPF